jgi:hypothetical protein
MSRTALAVTAVFCLATAVTACGPAPGNTLPVVTGSFGTDPLISLPAATLVFVIDVLAATHG